jgi:hypothetical protein
VWLANERRGGEAEGGEELGRQRPTGAATATRRRDKIIRRTMTGGGRGDPN